MKRLLPLVLLAFVGAGSPAREGELSAADILKRIDAVRNPQLDYQASVTISSYVNGKEPRVTKVELLVKGRDRAVIRTVEPPADRGRMLLMKGLDLWAFLPTISKPIRISLRERLNGDVSNADIARSDFAGDYNAEIAGREKIGERVYYRLQLEAKSPETPYGRITLWAEEKTYYPLRAEYYGLSGKLLKRCIYDRFRNVAGRLRPTRLTMLDPLHRDQRTVIEYDVVQVRELPDKLFTDGYMKKLS